MRSGALFCRRWFVVFYVIDCFSVLDRVEEGGGDEDRGDGGMEEKGKEGWVVDDIVRW